MLYERNARGRRPLLERQWWMVTLKGGATFELFCYSNEFLDALEQKLTEEGVEYDFLKYPPLRTNITDAVKERMAKEREARERALQAVA